MEVLKKKQKSPERDILLLFFQAKAKQTLVVIIIPNSETRSIFIIIHICPLIKTHNNRHGNDKVNMLQVIS